MKKLLLSFLLVLSFLCKAQQSIIVGPQNDCGTKGISKNVHTSSKWFDVSGVAKLKVTTQQHRTFDKSRIYNESGNLIWEWGGESFDATWYEKVHIVPIKVNKIRVEFYQGYKDPFCNGSIKVEKLFIENNLMVNNELMDGRASAAKTTDNNNISDVSNTNGRIITNNFSSSTIEANKKEFEKLLLKFNNTTSSNSSFSGYIKPYPSNPSDSYYKQDYYNNKLIYDGYKKKVITSTNGNTVYQDVFKHGKGKEYMINTNGYSEGYFLNDKLNGYGEHVSKNFGFSYKGYFINGERNGEGILVMDGLNGTTKYIYEGAFSNGKYNGKGTITYNFVSYTGSFVNDQINGSGVYLYPNGSKYVGNSINGKYEGYGEYYFADGNYYVGNFSNGNYNGLGEFTYINGTKLKGQWQNGNYVVENVKENSPNIANNQPRSSLIEGRTSAATVTSKTSQSKLTNEISFVRLGDIDVLTSDLGELTHDDAKNAIKNLGEGWRLPNRKELVLMFNNQDKIGTLSKREFKVVQDYWIYSGNYLGEESTGQFVTLRTLIDPGLTIPFNKGGADKRTFKYIRAVRDVPSNSISKLYNKTKPTGSSFDVTAEDMLNSKIFGNFVKDVLNGKYKEPIRNSNSSVGSATARCRIYLSKYSSGGDPIGYVDGNRVYSGKYSSAGNPVGYIDGNRIFSSKYSSGGNPIGYVDGNRIYSGKYSSGGNPVGYIDANRVYLSKYSSGGDPIGYGDGCGLRTVAAAALLLLF